VAVAKRTRNKVVCWSAAFAFYGVAVLGYVIMAGVLQHATR